MLTASNNPEHHSLTTLETLPNGDQSCAYEGSDHNDVVFGPPLLLSPEGRYLADLGGNFLLSLDVQPTDQDVVMKGQSGLNTVVVTTIGERLPGYKIAVKKIHPHSPISGIDQFCAMRALESKGVLCVTPLAATRQRFISRYIQGRILHTPSADFREYFETLQKVVEELQEEGSWSPDWILDANKHNYIINPTHIDDPLAHFIVLDPIVHRSQTARG
jgi:hypothetical protein